METAVPAVSLADPEKIKLHLISRGRIDPETKCWIWTGATRKGFGCVWIAGRTFQVSRLALRLWHGVALDQKSRVAATCRNRACFNPSHLIVMTPSAVLLMRRGPTCCRGHRFTKQNTYIDLRRGHRQCRSCRAISKSAYTARHGRRNALQLRAREEAKGLFRLVGQNGQTVQTVRDSIRPDEQLKQNLFSFIGKNSPEVRSAIKFRNLVLAEFEMLAGERKNRKRISVAEAEAERLPAVNVSLKPILKVRVVAA